MSAWVLWRAWVLRSRLLRRKRFFVFEWDLAAIFGVDAATYRHIKLKDHFDGLFGCPPFSCIEFWLFIAPSEAAWSKVFQNDYEL